MSIKIVDEDGLLCPTFFCDVCDKKVIKVRGKPEPLYAYKMEFGDNGDKCNLVDVHIICSPTCHDTIDAKFGERISWMPIDVMMVNLWVNLGYEATDFTKSVKRTSV